MHPDVASANGMEGGHVYGHEAVRDYWTRQWKLIDPQVEPQGFQHDQHDSSELGGANRIICRCASSGARFRGKTDFGSTGSDEFDCALPQC